MAEAPSNNGNGYQAGVTRTRLEVVERDVSEIKVSVKGIDDRQRAMTEALARIEAGLVGRDKLESDREKLSDRIGAVETWQTNIQSKLAILAGAWSIVVSIVVGLAVNWFKSRNP